MLLIRRSTSPITRFAERQWSKVGCIHLLAALVLQRSSICHTEQCSANMSVGRLVVAVGDETWHIVWMSKMIIVNYREGSWVAGTQAVAQRYLSARHGDGR